MSAKKRIGFKINGLTTATIVQNEDRLLEVELFDADAPSVPIDLTGWQSIAMQFRNADNSVLSVNAQNTSQTGGTFEIVVTDAQSALLKVGDTEHMEVEVDFGGGIQRTVQMPGALAVKAQLL